MTVLIGLPGDSTRTVANVESWPQGFVKVTSVDGKVDYISNVDIRWIRDSDGVDWTDRVLRKHGSVGMASAMSKAPPRTHGMTFRPQPLPWTKAYLVYELGFGFRLGPDNSVPEEDVSVSLELGYMRNLSTKNAVGFSVFGMTTDESGRVAVKGRYRRWLWRSVGLDATLGLTVFGEEEVAYPGLIASVGVQTDGVLGVALEAERIRHQSYVYVPPDDVELQTWSETEWRVRGQLGSGVGVVGTVALFVLGIAAAASWGGGY